MVTATLIIEIMGRPPEHLKKSLEEHIAKLEKVKEVELIKKIFSEPKLIEERKELYTAFSEVEIKVPTLFKLTEIVFDFMPASIEITEPSKLTMSLNEATDYLNHVSGRLHRYDEIVKIMGNRELKYYEELKIAKKLLVKNGIMSEDGKLITKENSKE